MPENQRWDVKDQVPEPEPSAMNFLKSIVVPSNYI
jgi:hypothetical protein